MKAKTITITAIFTAITIIFSQIVVFFPFSPVPVSMSLVAVFLAGALLEKKNALLIQIIYILLGIIGIPVFSGFSGGIGKILGATGGYLLAYPIMAFIISWIKEKSEKNNLWILIFGMLVSLIICYFAGTIWLAYVTKMGIYKAVLSGVIPFVITDIIKLIISALLANSLNSRLNIFVDNYTHKC